MGVEYSTTQNGKLLIFMWSSLCREKPYLFVLGNMHDNVTALFFSDVIFDTKSLTLRPSLSI